MKNFIRTVIDGLSYLFVGGSEEDHDAMPSKEKFRIVIGWCIAIIFCVTMLILLLH